MSPTVAAAIPTYRPDPSTLVPLIEQIVGWDVPLVVADDGSPCTSDRALQHAADLGAHLVRHRRNAGVARSLNDGLRFADSVGATWLLTVDQDSSLKAEHVSRLLASAAAAASALGPVGAVGAGSIADASGPLDYPLTVVDGIATTEELIQTGTMWAVGPLLAHGGFDEHLGIDAVDAAACLALRQAGYRIVVAPDVEIGHQIGAGRQVRVLGRDVLASGHSPERRTTIVRNRLSLFPGEFAQSPRHALRTLRRVTMGTALAVTVEEDRWQKAKASLRGLLPRPSR